MALLPYNPNKVESKKPSRRRNKPRDRLFSFTKEPVQVKDSEKEYQDDLDDVLYNPQYDDWEEV